MHASSGECRHLSKIIYSKVPPTYGPIFYHVTTNKDAVIKEGLKTREELHQERGLGLGGGPKSTVSLTEDLETAKAIYNALIIGKRLFSGEITYHDLVYDASFWDQSHYEAFKKFIEVNRLNVILDQRIKRKWDSNSKEFVEVEATEQDRIRALKDIFGEYLRQREWAGGLEDPVFFDADLENLANVPENQIAVLEFEVLTDAPIEWNDYRVEELFAWFKSQYEIDKGDFYSKDLFNEKKMYNYVYNYRLSLWKDEPGSEYQLENDAIGHAKDALQNLKKLKELLSWVPLGEIRLPSGQYARFKREIPVAKPQIKKAPPLYDFNGKQAAIYFREGLYCKKIYSASPYMKKFPDSDEMLLNLIEYRELKSKSRYRLGDYFDAHYLTTLPQYKYLEKLYPGKDLRSQIENIPVVFFEDEHSNIVAFYDYKRDCIHLNLAVLLKQPANYVVKIILHEVTHYFQHKFWEGNHTFEGRPRNVEEYFSNPNEIEAFKTEVYQMLAEGKSMRQIYDSIKEEYGIPPEEYGIIADFLAKIMDEMDADFSKEAAERKFYAIIGPPASGKGTQAQLISDSFGIPHIDAGSLLREGKYPKQYERVVRESLTEGTLLPDEVITEIVLSRLEEPDCENGFILDGFPRSVGQAKALDEFMEKRGEKIEKVFSLKVSEEEILKRVLGRGRADDTKEILKTRLEEYYKKTKPLEDYYKDRIIDIEAGESPEKTYAQIEKYAQKRPIYTSDRKIFYHVTTAKDKVLREGFKSRKELGMGGGVGLGGGRGTGISLTRNINIAKAIKNAIVMDIRLAKGQISMDEMINMAKKQGFYRLFIENLREELDLNMKLNDLLNLCKYYENEMRHGRKDYFENEEGVFCPVEAFINAWHDAREEKFGIVNPFFELIDYENVRKIDENDVAIIEVGVEEGAEIHEGEDDFLDEVVVSPPEKIIPLRVIGGTSLELLTKFSKSDRKILYHVTTAKDKVLKEGLKNRKELGMEKGVGLGGGRGELVSTTDDYETAKNIYDTLLLAHRYYSGKITWKDLLEMAQKGEGADKPYSGGLEVRIEHGWDKKLDNPSNLADRKSFFNQWLWAREIAGGPENVVLFDVDIENFVKIPEDQIAILEIEVSPQAIPHIDDYTKELFRDFERNYLVSEKDFYEHNLLQQPSNLFPLMRERYVEKYYREGDDLAKLERSAENKAEEAMYYLNQIRNRILNSPLGEQKFAPEDIKIRRVLSNVARKTIYSAAPRQVNVSDQTVNCPLWGTKVGRETCEACEFHEGYDEDGLVICMFEGEVRSGVGKKAIYSRLSNEEMDKIIKSFRRWTYRQRGNPGVNITTWHQYCRDRDYSPSIFYQGARKMGLLGPKEAYPIIDRSYESDPYNVSDNMARAENPFDPNWLENIVNRYFDYLEERGKEDDPYAWRNFCMRNELGKKIYQMGAEFLDYPKVPPWVGVTARLRKIRKRARGKEEYEMMKEEIIERGGQINPDDTIDLYHATTPEAAEKIMESGVLTTPASDEYGVYASTSPEIGEDYGAGALIKIRVPLKDVFLDDVFPDGRMDFRIPTRRGMYRPQKMERLASSILSKNYIVYRGSDKTNLYEIKPMFFAEEEDAARYFIRFPHGVLTKAKVNINHPFVINDDKKVKEFLDLVRRAGVDLKNTLDYGGERLSNWLYYPEVRQQLLKEGYDGVKMIDEGDGMKIKIIVPLKISQVEIIEQSEYEYGELVKRERLASKDKYLWAIKDGEFIYTPITKENYTHAEWLYNDYGIGPKEYDRLLRGTLLPMGNKYHIDAYFETLHAVNYGFVKKFEYWMPKIKSECEKLTGKKCEWDDELIKRLFESYSSSRKKIYSANILMRPLPEIDPNTEVIYSGEKGKASYWFDLPYLLSTRGWKYLESLYPDIKYMRDDIFYHLQNYLRVIFFDDEGESDAYVFWLKGDPTLGINLHYINKMTKDEIENVLLHELAHYIQFIAGLEKKRPFLNPGLLPFYLLPVHDYLFEPSEYEAFKAMIKNMYVNKGKSKEDIISHFIKMFPSYERKDPIELHNLIEKFVNKVLEDIEKEEAKYASVLDIPHSTLDPELWEDGKLKPEIKEQIILRLYKWLEEKGVGKDWIKGIYFIGSSAGYQYRETSDMDITIIPDADLLAERVEPLGGIKEFIFSMVSELNGYYIFKHDVNYYIKTVGEIPVGEAIYNLFTDEWVKSPRRFPEGFDPEEEYKSEILQSESRIAAIDTVIGKLYRRTKDCLILWEYLTKEITPYIQEKFERKMEVIDQLCEWLKNEYLDIWRKRKKAYDIQGKQDTKENIMYKYMERYGYLALMHEIYDIYTEGIKDIEDVRTIKDIISNLFSDMLD